MQHPLWWEDWFGTYKYAWPFVKCTYRMYSMLLNILPSALCTKSSVSPGFAKQIMPVLRILCYNGSLVTWTVVSLTAAKFKPLIQNVSKWWTRFEIAIYLQPPTAREWNSYHLKGWGIEFQMITARCLSQRTNSPWHGDTTTQIVLHSATQQDWIRNCGVDCHSMAFWHWSANAKEHSSLIPTIWGDRLCL
jgi:hypothetical protein